MLTRAHRSILTNRYQTTDHLPINRGFDTHLGYLLGDQNYQHGLQVMCDVPNLARRKPPFATKNLLEDTDGLRRPP